MERSWQNARKNGYTPKGLVLISPNNPTGKVMTKRNLIDIIKWAYKRNVKLLFVHQFLGCADIR